MRPYRTERWITEASKTLKTRLVPHTRGEACGPCPQCGGKDRFIAFAEGNYWCRRCHIRGWWVDNPDEARIALAAERERSEEEQAKLRGRMAQCRDWIEYHRQALELTNARGEWAGHGMGEREIKKWGLGYCESCPTAPSAASLTIPFFQDGALIDIRHRLIDPPPGMGKYRPHMAGLAAPIFNLDAVALGEPVVVTEGAKKAIILEKYGVKAPIGIPGTNTGGALVRVLPGRLNGQGVVVALDPDAGKEARDLAERLSLTGVKRVYVADFFMKPDDLALAYGSDLLKDILRQALRCRGDGRRSR